MAERLKTLLFASINPISKDAEMDVLPLHVSITPAFNVEPRQNKELSKRLKERVERFNVFTIIGLEASLFGPEEDIPVRKVGGVYLYEVHDAVLPVVKNVDKQFSMEYAGEQFSPHVTERANSVMREGERAIVNKLHLAQQDNTWRILESFDLKVPDPAMYQFDIYRTNV